MEMTVDARGNQVPADRSPGYTQFVPNAVPRFLCPISEKQESTLRHRKRVLVLMVLVNILTPNHAHLLHGVNALDIGTLMALITQLVHGSTAKRMVQAMFSLFNLKKQPGSPWPAFAAKVTNLHATVFRTGLPSEYSIGYQLFTAAVMSACDSDPSYATALTLIRREETTPPIAEVLSQLGEVVVGKDAPIAFMATGKFCFDYLKGQCRRGAGCRFRHALEVPPRR